MATTASASPSYVLKAKELAALNFLEPGHPRPTGMTWINRGTDQVLRPTTVEVLMRTLFTDAWSPSVRRLHQTAGLRVSFSSESDRARFSKVFARAQAMQRQLQRSALTAVFDKPAGAERGFRELIAAGVNPRAISILWRAGQFLQPNPSRPSGHSRMSVAAASAGGGLAGAIFGMTLLVVPGIGQVAAGGAILGQLAGTIGAVGGALGASGGGLARMLTDFDVDDREVPYFEMAIKRGKVFLSVDAEESGVPADNIHDILERCGGQFATQEADAASNEATQPINLAAA